MAKANESATESIEEVITIRNYGCIEDEKIRYNNRVDDVFSCDKKLAKIEAGYSASMEVSLSSLFML